MNKSSRGIIRIAMAAVAAGMLFGGCASIQQWYAEQQVKWREARVKEYHRLSNLPPAEPVATPDKDIALCAAASCALLNESVPLMRAYVAQIESSHEFTGYINDIQYLIENDKMDPKAACDKVTQEVMAADASLPEEEKIWPKIVKGIQAYQTLGTTAGEKRISELFSRNLDIGLAVGKIEKKLHKQEKELKHEKDKRAKKAREQEIAARRAECWAVRDQLSTSMRCISIMRDQADRASELEQYAR